MALPLGYEAQISTRSGLARQEGDYADQFARDHRCRLSGEVMTPVINPRAPFVIERGMRIAQMLTRRCRRWKLWKWRSWMRPREGRRLWAYGNRQKSEMSKN
jgi:dUTPase